MVGACDPSICTSLCPRGPNRFLFGDMYDAVLIGANLSNSQVQDIMYGRRLPTEFDCRLWHDYRLGHTIDLSGNGNHGTIVGNVRFV